MNEIDPFAAWPQVCSALGSNGAILMSGEPGNPMTIGWATLGVVWGKTVLTVLVRPSRFSFALLESLPQFTVNVLDPDRFKRQLAFCGSHSGRDRDKLTECGFTTEESQRVRVPHLGEAQLVYECAVVHKTTVVDADLAADIRGRYYPRGDLHRIYHAEVLSAVTAG